MFGSTEPLAFISKQYLVSKKSEFSTQPYFSAFKVTNMQQPQRDISKDYVYYRLFHDYEKPPPARILYKGKDVTDECKDKTFSSIVENILQPKRFEELCFLPKK